LNIGKGHFFRTGRQLQSECGSLTIKSTHFSESVCCKPVVTYDIAGANSMKVHRTACYM